MSGFKSTASETYLLKKSRGSISLVILVKEDLEYAIRYEYWIEVEDAIMHSTKGYATTRSAAEAGVSGAADIFFRDIISQSVSLIK